jgi:hypothetical protein
MANEVMQIATVESKLQQAIDDAFHETGIHSFLASLSSRNVSFYGPGSLEQASSDLTDRLSGGAYTKGDIFETSFISLYQALDAESQKRLRSYWYSKVESVEEKLRTEFPNVFRKPGGVAVRN